MIKELVSFSDMLLKKVHTSKNAANMLTKLVITDNYFDG